MKAGISAAGPGGSFPSQITLNADREAVTFGVNQMMAGFRFKYLGKLLLWAAFALSVYGLGGGCTRLFPHTYLHPQRFEFSRPEMGVQFRIVLYDDWPRGATNAAEAAFKRIEDLNAICSDYDSDSELSQLSLSSGQRKKVRVSDDLWRVLQISRDLFNKSDGAFDITVGPFVNLWRKARRDQKMPDPAILAEAKARVGFGKIRFFENEQSVELLVPNMRLDLGGIAKGYAVDEAMKVLAWHGIHICLVAGSGDIAVGEAPPGKPGWRVEITPLDIPDGPAKSFVLLKNAGISTSGDLSQRLEIGGVRYSHIVDPRTGVGLTDHSLVTIIGKNSVMADGLDTTVSVLGPEKGLKLVKATRGAEARIVRAPGPKLEVYETRGFKKFYAPKRLE